MSINIRKKLTTFLITVIITAAFSLSAYSATITVDTADDEFDFFGPNGQCSLREAISAANIDGPVDSCATGSGDDVIIFDESLEGATIVLDITGSGEDDNVTGDLDVNGTGSLEILGTSTTARPLELPDPIIIDGNETDRVIDVFSELTLFNVTIQNGGSVPVGGGIRTDTDVTLNLDTVTVTDNQLEAPFPGASISGAGINASGPLNILFTIIGENEASGPGVVASGGGIKYSGLGTTMVISRSIIGNNILNSDGGGLVSGGGIDVISSGNVVISNSLISNNRAEIIRGRVDSNVFGGAINFQSGGTLTITESVITQNIAQIEGDGDTVQGGGISFMVGVIERSEISNNLAMSDNASIIGGGIYTTGNLEIINTTISGNSASTVSADSSGAGVYANAAANVFLNNTTIADNSGSSASGLSSGGGIENDGGLLTSSNTIIALNSADSGPDCSGTVSSDNFNLVGDDSDCGFTPLGDDIVNTDPVLGPLAENGADTRTHALLEGSPAIDMADPADPAGAGTCETEDQRGEMRPFDGDDDGTARCDIGAFELQEAAMAPEIGTTGGGSGCFLAALGSAASLSIYSMIPLMILIRRILSIKSGGRKQ